jgi:hypothetical protein
MRKQRGKKDGVTATGRSTEMGFRNSCQAGDVEMLQHEKRIREKKIVVPIDITRNRTKQWKHEKIMTGTEWAYIFTAVEQQIENMQASVRKWVQQNRKSNKLRYETQDERTRK